MRGKDVVNQCRPNSFHLVGSDARSHSASADRDPALDLTICHALSQRHDVIGIVIFRSQTGRAKVQNLMSGLTQPFGQFFLQGKPCMIRGNSDTHYFASLFLFTSSMARSQMCSTVKPYSRITTSPGAEAPKRSTPITSLSSPAYLHQPWLAPASTASRARTKGGRTDSR